MAISFPTTAWSMVKAAGEKQGPGHVDAVNRFACGYWKPVYYYVRCRRYNHQDAEDITQEFFLKFLEKEWFTKADHTRGRFRQYLLTVLKGFVSEQGPNRRPKQKGFESSLVSISTLLGDEDRSFEPSSDTTPDEVFSDHWAHSVLANVLRRLTAWCGDKGRPDWQLMFESVYFPPDGQKKAHQEELASRFGQTRDQIRYALKQTSGQFQSFLQEEVRDQVWTDGEIETEIRDLMALVGRKSI